MATAIMVVLDIVVGIPVSLYLSKKIADHFFPFLPRNTKDMTSTPKIRLDGYTHEKGEIDEKVC